MCEAKSLDLGDATLVKDKPARGLRYWNDHSSLLGLQEAIRHKVPWYIRHKVFVDNKYVDKQSNTLRVFFHIGKNNYGRGFSYEFHVDELEKIAAGRDNITTKQKNA